MENASKALIIAGAILLAIIIISLGIVVVNNARNQIGNANLSETEVTAFNAKWEPYEGGSKSVSEVQTMIQAVRTSNATETKTGTNRWIKVTKTGTPNSSTISTAANALVETAPRDSSKAYTIKLGYDTATGLIVGIDFQANGTTTQQPQQTGN